MDSVHAVATPTGFFLCKTADDARICCLKGKPEEPGLPSYESSNIFCWFLDVRDKSAHHILMTLNATVYVKVAIGMVKEMSICDFIKAINKAAGIFAAPETRRRT